jgi:formate dehydrogenase major subunit
MMNDHLKERKVRTGMNLTRRDFIRVSGATVSGAALASLGVRGASAAGSRRGNVDIKYARESTTICPYCAVGCGIIVSAHAGRVVNMEGDPDHPVNEGTLCSKAHALRQVSENQWRLTKPLYRAPRSSEWQEVSWEWILNEIAKKIKKSRDAGFTKTNADGQVVNRNDAMASVGSAALDNEECFILQKWLRALGLVYIEHQARI